MPIQSIFSGPITLLMYCCAKGGQMSIQLKPMKPSVRQAAIAELVGKTGRVSVETLAERFDASPETVRRDLSVLAREGRIRKIHGGAERPSHVVESSFEERLGSNLRAKREVAEKLAKIVRPGQTVMMDTGSATLICAEALGQLRDLTVVTNSFRIAERISTADNGSRAVILGGRYNPENAQTLGARVCAEVAMYRPDHTVLTVSAVDASGAYDFTDEEAMVARAMIANAGDLTVVADLSKLNQTSTYKICEHAQINRLVLEGEPGDELKHSLMQSGVEIV